VRQVDKPFDPLERIHGNVDGIVGHPTLRGEHLSERLIVERVRGDHVAGFRRQDQEAPISQVVDALSNGV